MISRFIRSSHLGVGFYMYKLGARSGLVWRYKTFLCGLESHRRAPSLRHCIRVSQQWEHHDAELHCLLTTIALAVLVDIVGPHADPDMCSFLVQWVGSVPLSNYLSWMADSFLANETWRIFSKLGFGSEPPFVLPWPRPEVHSSLMM